MPPFVALDDPLARPVWSALRGRQTGLALAHGRARRFRPDVGLFASVDDETPEALADLGALIARHGQVGLVEPAAPPAVAGAEALSSALCWQMTARELRPAPAPDAPILPLGDGDAAEMLELATLTRPGPFFANTHRLGGFVGIRLDGRLLAMAGERMKTEGASEVSGVCTHPDARGRGYASALMRAVAGRILARGETPFLHAYPDNNAAISLHRSLGFEPRRELTFTILGPA
jgi:predicted GNAT family acetyltransferase